MAWVFGADGAADATADEGEVAYDVKEFVAGGLVVEFEGSVDVAVVAEFCLVAFAEGFEFGEVFCGDWAVVDYDGVLEVAAFDESCCEEGENFADEDECAAVGYLLCVVGEVLEGGVLAWEDC